MTWQLGPGLPCIHRALAQQVGAHLHWLPRHLQAGPSPFLEPHPAVADTRAPEQGCCPPSELGERADTDRMGGNVASPHCGTHVGFPLRV